MAAEACTVCDGRPRVLVVMGHPAMLRLTRKVLERECACSVQAEAGTGEALAVAIDRFAPHVVVVDTADFPGCCRSALERIPPDRVIVIGPEPDPAYRVAALDNGAGAWIPRDRVGDDLARETRRILGCVHGPVAHEAAASIRPNVVCRSTESAADADGVATRGEGRSQP